MQEDEINLRDYFNVVLKRKKIILTVFCITVIATAVVNFLMPGIYSVSMILELPIIGVTSEGMPIYLDSAKSAEAKIKEGAFNSKIIKVLNLHRKDPLEFKISEVGSSDILKVIMLCGEKETEDGIKILNQLFSELSNDYLTQVEFKKNSIENEISAISYSIAAKNNEIKSRERMLGILKEREIDLKNEIGEIKSSKMFANRDALLFNYLNQLNNQLIDLRMEREKNKISITNLRTEIELVQISKGSLVVEKSRVSNVRLIQKPTVLSTPIQLKKGQNISMAIILGLIFGVFVAFFWEFWNKNWTKSAEKR